MMCVCVCFFVSVITVWGSNTALNFFKSILFDGKVKFKIVTSFQKRREKQNKNSGKPVIFTKNRFLTKSILVFRVALKQMKTIRL